ncbi:maltotransferase domain-containing protein [Siphonobacter aquaeclarae]|uniref:Alpha-1,4-glucan:maltose-1-phosphate maltosyltransferase n=1 Tax=Siphonobacter aquaeclarae TaxID=563176 RepID=A0A1G9U495_9BACT|nr:maltotransferase domain-containing protein [Siphonobacter aquaeclarae]SDM54830.1 alpha-1,4-glucan:maltose-1-phosphate maltosyltransferase [Siphonobacter aquaeclarae]
MESGTCRVYITGVFPELEEGRFSAKGLAGDVFTVEADFLSDSFERVSGHLLIRHETRQEWERVRMEDLGNDRFRGHFRLTETGFYVFTVEAWIDHALTWQENLRIKLQDRQSVEHEIAEGIRLFSRMAEDAAPEDKPRLEQINSELAGTDTFHLALSQEVTDWIHRYPVPRHRTRYRRELTVFAERERAAFSAWYNLFPRSTAPAKGLHGTFATTAKLLPRMAELGFDVLQIPPVHPIGRQFRKGRNNAAVAQPGEPGVPYAVGNELGGHDAIHPELGTLDDFRHLIRQAAAHGIEIAMDLAVQCAPDHPWVSQHPGWFRHRPDGSIQYAENPPHKYQDSYPFDFECDDWENLWKALRDVVFCWAEWGVRLIRADQPHGKPFLFWEWLIRETRAKYPDLLFVAESFTKPKTIDLLGKIGFAQNYTYFIWRNTKEELTEYVHELAGKSAFLRPNFWPNTHDINPFPLQSGLEPVFLTRFFLAATLSSNYGIYGPVFEQMYHEAFPGQEEYLNSEKYEIAHWEWDRENKLTLLIRLVNRIRKENSALQRTDNLTFVHLPNDALIGYLKVHENGNQVLCVVNLDPHHRQSAGIYLPPALIGRREDEPYLVHDLLTGNRWQWQGDWNYVELDPAILPLHLFRIEYPVS